MCGARRAAPIPPFGGNGLRNEFPLREQTLADFSAFGLDGDEPLVVSEGIFADERNTDDFNNRVGDPQSLTVGILRIRVVYRVILLSDKSVHFTVQQRIAEDVIPTSE